MLSPVTTCPSKNQHGWFNTPTHLRFWPVQPTPRGACDCAWSCEGHFKRNILLTNQEHHKLGHTCKIWTMNGLAFAWKHKQIVTGHSSTGNVPMYHLEILSTGSASAILNILAGNGGCCRQMLCFRTFFWHFVGSEKNVLNLTAMSVSDFSNRSVHVSFIKWITVSVIFCKLTHHESQVTAVARHKRRSHVGCVLTVRTFMPNVSNCAYIHVIPTHVSAVTQPHCLGCVWDFNARAFAFVWIQVLFFAFHDISRQGSKIRKFIHSKTSGRCYDFLRKSAGRLLFMNRNSVMRSGTCWMCRFYVELAKMKKRVAAKPRGADLELCVIF